MPRKTKKVRYQEGGNVDVSRQAYNRPYEREKELTIGGDKYVLDDSYNRRDTVVYRNPDTNDTYLGVRGTEVNKGSKRKYDDLWEDALIATGAEKLFLTKRNKKTQRIAGELLDDLGGDKSKLKVSGHSLGGSVASNVSKKYGLDAELYNPGSSPLALYTDAKSALKPSKGNVKVWSTGVDPLSAAYYYIFPSNKKTKVDWTASNPHGLDNFNHLIEDQRKKKK